MMNGIEKLWSSEGFMPHGHCYLWNQNLLWTMAISDALIGLSYVCISLVLYFLVKKIRLPFSAVFLAFGAFIAACGATHFVDVLTLWVPVYWFALLVRIITVIASVSTAILLFPIRPKIIELVRRARSAKESEEFLVRAHNELELRVAERTIELGESTHQAQRAVEARDEFLSIASHELKTPITSLKLQLQMTQKALTSRKVIDAEVLSPKLGSALRQIDRLTALIEDLLDVSKIESGKLSLRSEQVNLTEVVKDVCERLQEQFQGAACSVDLKLDSSVEGTWDRTRLEQVVLNLVLNAIKYAGGCAIHLEVSRQSGIARLVVSDEGPGIEAEKQERIFERFERVTASRSIDGLGLGLFIVKKIVQAHQGSIKLESEVGQGSRFIVELPLHFEANETKEIEARV